MNKLDLVGIRFGRLVVQKPARDVRRYSRNYCTWKCLCDCGNSKTVYTEDIRGGSTASTGFRLNSNAEDSRNEKL